MLKLCGYILKYWRENEEYVTNVLDNWRKVGAFERVKFRIMTRIVVYTAGLYGYKENDPAFIAMIFEGGKR